MLEHALRETRSPSFPLKLIIIVSKWANPCWQVNSPHEQEPTFLRILISCRGPTCDQEPFIFKLGDACMSRVMMKGMLTLPELVNMLTLPELVTHE